MPGRAGLAGGLAEARDLLGHEEGIAFRHFTEVDVVRHPLVARIVVAYDRRDQTLARDRERSMAPRATRSQGAAAPPAGEFTAEKGEDRE